MQTFTALILTTSSFSVNPNIILTQSAQVSNDESFQESHGTETSTQEPLTSGIIRSRFLHCYFHFYFCVVIFLFYFLIFYFLFSVSSMADISCSFMVNKIPVWVGFKNGALQNDPATEDGRFTEACFVESLSRRRLSRQKTLCSLCPLWLKNCSYHLP